MFRKMEQARKIVFFDGGCLLCSAAVQWTHRRDRRGEIWFAALESEFASQYREELGLPEAGEGAETFVYWDRERKEVTFKSSGALSLLRELGGFWAFLSVVGGLFPRSIRDWFYDLIARNRRQWFGASEECQLPPASLRGKVLA
ncbi:MAG: thiol-disulfide oxidoreductase DCC family protein [Roseibacillus sp.]